MATIRRHSIPSDSYAPDRPLNDLMREQLTHFIHVEERLPPEQRVSLPIPSPDDSAAANRFIAAVTERLMGTRLSQAVEPARKNTPKLLKAKTLSASEVKASTTSKARTGKKAVSKPKHPSKSTRRGK